MGYLKNRLHAALVDAPIVRSYHYSDKAPRRTSLYISTLRYYVYVTFT